MLQRLERINDDFAYSIREERRFEGKTSAATDAEAKGGVAAPGTPKKSKETLLSVSTSGPISVKERSPSITLEPASPRSAGPSSQGAHSVGSDENASFASADEEVQSEAQEQDTTLGPYIERRWHSLLRILYIYALLNPSTGYVQGMNEVLFLLLYVMGTSGHLPSAKPFLDNDEGQSTAAGQPDEAFLSDADASSSFSYLDRTDEGPGAHAEADAFWCFSALVGDIRNLYDFDGIEHAGLRIINRRQAESTPSQVTGMASALKKFSLRLKWHDEELWRQLRLHSLDPRLPYYSFRWLACLVSTELALPSVVRVWDALLAESSEALDGNGDSTPKVEFLIDVCCALLTNIRGSLLDALRGEGDSSGYEGGQAEQDDSFGRAMRVLQAYPDDDIGPVIEMACLYRQKRLAAPLTGDGPPSEDEDESLMSMRERAAIAFRTWTASSTPSRVPKWLNSTPRLPTTSSPQGEGSTPSRSSSATLFKRYTEALQSSDAAANLSKASTNWTAKAMATWSGSKGTRDGSSLAELRTSLTRRAASGTSAASSTSQDSQQVHPSLRWSLQSMPPDLPLPNVNDSPPLQEDGSHSPRHGYTPAHLRGSPAQSPDIGYVDSTPGTSPLSGSASRFAGPPSLQGTPRTMIRGAGPKPLLLTGSARPPREGSSNGALAAEDTSSRKISSGPLAANVSPQARKAKAGRRESSYTGSRTSSVAGTDSPSNDAWEESTSMSGRSETNNLPALPSLQAAREVVAPSLATSGPPPGLQGSGHGTVPASAFGKGAGQGQGLEQGSRLIFGQVASSADVPLASKAALQRKPKRKDSALSSPPTGDVWDSFSSPRDSATSSNSSQGFAMLQNSLGVDEFDHPRQAPAPPSKNGRADAEEQSLKRYSLADEPVMARQASNSSTRSFGVVRSKRTYSGPKRDRRSARKSLGEGWDEGGYDQGTDLVARGGLESVRLGWIKGDGDSQLTVNASKAALASPGIPSPGPDAGRMLQAEELLNRLQTSQGFSGGESSGVEDEGVTPGATPRVTSMGGAATADVDDVAHHGAGKTNRDYYASLQRSTPTYLPRDVYSDDEVDGNPARFSYPKHTGGDDDEHYAKDGMAAIGSALAFAGGPDDDDDNDESDGPLEPPGPRHDGEPLV